MKWYKRDPEAFAGGTAGLTLEETGAYTTILDLLYSTDDRVPDDNRFLARLFRCDLRIARRLKERLLVVGKLTSDNGFLHNARVTSEIREWQHRMEGRWERKQQELRANLRGTSEALPRHLQGTSPPTITEKANENNENILNSAQTTTTTTTIREEERKKERAATSAAAPQRTAKTTLPESWHPMEVLSPSESLELEKMRDWAKAGAIRKADWFATWRNWKRRSPQFNGGGNGSRLLFDGQPARGSREDLRRRTVAALDQLREYGDAGPDDEGGCNEAGAPPSRGFPKLIGP